MSASKRFLFRGSKISNVSLKVLIRFLYAGFSGMNVQKWELFPCSHGSSQGKVKLVKLSFGHPRLSAPVPSTSVISPERMKQNQSPGKL